MRLGCRGQVKNGGGGGFFTKKNKKIHRSVQICFQPLKTSNYQDIFN